MINIDEIIGIFHDPRVALEARAGASASLHHGGRETSSKQGTAG